MINSGEHTFHIPVLGIGFSVDAPLKVARYGISSVVSLVDDTLMEELRRNYLEKENKPFVPIGTYEEDSRARRVTAYLNMMNSMVKEQFNVLRNSAFELDNDLHKYFELLPDVSQLKQTYREMMATTDERVGVRLQQWLRDHMHPGSIDVNIMTKLDKVNYAKSGDAMSNEFNDAHASLRGFAMSDLESSVVFSAGMNPRLYGYIANFPDFFPSEEGKIKKGITIKVSDFRSALIQGKFLAKKGLWVSEFRIESGLNCGGHAFATDGYLLGPILEEFKTRRDELQTTMREIYVSALQRLNIDFTIDDLRSSVTVQGGVGQTREHEFLLRHYNVDSVGWGSPFLLVPEVMNIDDDTLSKLQKSKSEDLYLSSISPLGVPFNSLRGNTKDIEKKERVAAGKPGSACIKKFLSLNTELSEKPLCTASIQFLKKKKQVLQEEHTVDSEYKEALDASEEKACLCEGLIVSALTVNHIEMPKISKAVSVCPGPNIAYFSLVSTLRDMVDHIYGRMNLLTDPDRPNMFIKELLLYVDYLQKYVEKSVKPVSEKTEEYIESFRQNLVEGINYYQGMIPEIIEESDQVRARMAEELTSLENRLLEFVPALA
jgi:hypothetical protein